MAELSRTRTVSGRILSPFRLGAVVLTGLVLPLAPGGCTPTTDDSKISGISVIDAKALADTPPEKRKVLFIDARPADEFAKGHVPRARSVDITKVSGVPGQTDPKLEGFGTLVVYGNDPASGNATALTKKLMMTGYSKVRMMMDGVSAWARAGFPVETGP